MTESQHNNKALIAVILSGVFLLFNELNQPKIKIEGTAITIGNSSTLISAYERWKTQKIVQQKENYLLLPLTYVKGHTKNYSQARGRAILNLVSGELDLKISGLPRNNSFDVWLLDKHKGTGDEADNSQIYIGQLSKNVASLELQITLDAGQLASFELNRIEVTYAGQTPEQGSLLTGSPTLFQRLFYNERRLMSAAPDANTLYQTKQNKKADSHAPV